MNIHSEITHIIQMQHLIGCGNHGCRYHKVTGQGTNAGCRCDERIASTIVNFYIKNRADFNRQVDYQVNYYNLYPEQKPKD